MSSSSTLRSRGVVRLVQKRLRARSTFFDVYISNDPKNSPEVVFFDACARARGPFSRGVCVSLYAYFFSHTFATFFSDQIFPSLKIRLSSSSSSYHGGTPGEHLRDGEGPRELPVLLQGKRGPKRRSRDLFLCVRACWWGVFPSRIESDRIGNRSTLNTR